ncbi:MAG: zinc-binding dehydrogenase [Streptosporangiaceae bacterium]
MPRRFPRSPDRLPSCSQGVTVRGAGGEPAGDDGVDEPVCGLARPPAPAAHHVRFTGDDPAGRAREALPELARRITAGQLSIPVWCSHPLADPAAAHADLEAGRNHGKIVLLP